MKRIGAIDVLLQGILQGTVHKMATNQLAIIVTKLGILSRTALMLGPRLATSVVVLDIS